MPRTIYNDTTIDGNTGEVLKQRTITRVVENKEQFIKAYVADIAALIQCSNSEKNLVICMIKLGYIEYDSNEIVLNMPRKENLCSCAEINIRSMHNSLYRLIKKNIIIRSGKKMVLNPKLFFYGKETEREKLFELNIKYKIKK